MRVRLLLVVALLVVVALHVVLTPPGRAQNPGFTEWLDTLLAEARRRGFSDALLEQTLVGLTPLDRVIKADRRQTESVLTFEEYVRRRITPEVVQRGRELADEHRELLARIRDAYGVPPPIVLSIWANESRFGRFAGDIPVFQALATLAWDPRRAPYFRGELFHALSIVAAGHIEPASMVGSWAGAMGQPQFMPSSYLAYAVDFDGDGRRDIWTSYADTFASIANYLKEHGWRADEPWGREASMTPAVATRVAREVPERGAGCRAMRAMTSPAALATWQRLGVRGTNGEALTDAAPDAALVSAGQRRFLVHRNYDALLRYNCHHHYALAVALLADRIAETPQTPDQR